MAIVRETSTIPLDEDGAALIVDRLILQAIMDMVALSQRYLLAGKKLDRRLLDELVRALERLAEEYALQSVRGRWGWMIEAALREGRVTAAEAAKAAQAAGLAVPREAVRAVTSRAAVDAALYARRIQIRNILRKGAEFVGRLVADNIVRARPLPELAEAVWRGLMIDGKAVPRWRAELIARNELFAAYRQGNEAVAAEAEAPLRQMTGPVDIRTSAICLQYVGKVLTPEQWLAVEKNVFVYGLHIGCRHGWDPVWSVNSTVLSLETILRDRADAEIRRRIEEREAMKAARKAA